MLKINLLILCAVLLAVSLPVGAQQKWRFVTSKKVAYLKKRDAALEKAIRQLEQVEPGEEVRYHYNTVDLNGDDKLDAVVFVSGSTVCGTGGCPVLIFKGDGRVYSLITEMSVSRAPIFVGVTRTKGWNDLMMEVYGGGIKPYFALLKFDGKTYPDNPTVEPALPKRSRAKFIEYLSGIETYDTGLELK